MVTLHNPECVAILETARARFEARLSSPDENGCRDWIGKQDAHGYGSLKCMPIGKDLKAHRVAWILANGKPIPMELPKILHSCDRPSCCAGEHLHPGTQIVNCAEMRSRGRHSAGRGDDHGHAKLNWEIVATIRIRLAAGESGAALGREYGVGRDEISRINTGKIWIVTANSQNATPVQIPGS